MEHSEHFPDSFHRVTIKGLCVRDGKILLSRESMPGEPELWEMPGGGLDFGEDIKEGLRREIQEEMGLKVTKISEHPVYVWTHKFPPNSRKIGWYYSIIVAYRVEFEDLNITPSEECQEVRFFSKEELSGIPRSGQTTKLPDIFNPEDFSESF
jgi:8-oxo-dGTP diphosphatase